MVLGVDERAVRDGINVLSSDDFDACLAIVVCRMGPNFFAYLSQVAGHYKGDANPAHESRAYQRQHSHPALA